MKIKLLPVSFLIFLLGCQSHNHITNNINVSSKLIIPNKIYQVDIQPNEKSKKYYLQVISKCMKDKYEKSNVYEFQKKGNKLVAEFEVDTNAYNFKLSVADSSEILRDFNYLSLPVYRCDSNLAEFSHYDLLMNANESDYLQIFKDSRRLYPNNLGIFIIRWMYEAENNKAIRDSLASQVKYIKENFKNSPDYNFVLYIGYKLLKDTLWNQYFKKIIKEPIRLINNEYIASMFNEVNQIAPYNNNIKITKGDLFEVIKNNKTSFWSTRILTNLFMEKSIYDTSIVTIINEIGKKDRPRYFNFQFLKYMKLISCFLPDSVKVANEIESEINKAYKNPFGLFKIGLNDNFEQLYNKQVFNEFRFWHHIKISDYPGAINIEKEKIKDYTSSKSIMNSYLRIGQVYEENIKNLDSAYFYYYQAYNQDNESEYVLKKLKLVYNKYYHGSLQYDKWEDSMRTQSKKGFKNSNFIINKVKKGLNVVFNNDEKIDLSRPNKNTFLVFYSSMCIPCKYILADISKGYKNNISFDDVEIVYISKDDYKDINLLNKSYLMKLSFIKNVDELFNEFNVSAVPVTILINRKGQIVDKQEGANNNWSIKENLKIE